MIGVIFGGPSAEHDISILTGLQAARALADAGEDVAAIYWTQDLQWYRVPTSSEAIDFVDARRDGWKALTFDMADGFAEAARFKSRALALDAVLNCCHGGPGEDGALQGALAMAGIPATGPTASCAAMSMDKLATYALCRALDIPTIASAIPEGPAEALPDTPWIAKPRFGGSSIGVEAGVEDLATVEALGRQGVGRAGMLIQPFLEGWTDINIGVRSFPERQTSPVERPLKAEGGATLSFADKYLTGGQGMDQAPRELPAQIPGAIAERMREATLRLAAAMRLTGAPRIDFLWDGGDTVLLNEINPIPGAWGLYLWEAAGVSRLQFYRDLIAEARTIEVLPPSWHNRSDGAALRASKSIAAKLL